MHELAFNTITETDATPAISAIYREIKSTMGVSLVNLIWRHLATDPVVLQWAWRSLQPHYTSGAIPDFAWQLRNDISPPVLDPLSEQESCLIQGEPDDLSIIDSLLHTYERGNAQNLIAMCYLQRCTGAGDREQTVDSHTRERRQSDQDTDRVAHRIPPLPNSDTLNPEQRALIKEMTKKWVPEIHRGITPSVFRHLALWPDALAILHHRLCRSDSIDEITLNRASEQVIAHAKSFALQLSLPDTAPPDLAFAQAQWLDAALVRFIDGMIAPGVIIVPAMQAVLQPMAGRQRR